MQLVGSSTPAFASHRARHGVAAALPLRQVRVAPAAYGRPPPRPRLTPAAGRGHLSSAASDVAPMRASIEQPQPQQQQQQPKQQEVPHILQQWATRLAKGAAVLGLAMALLLGRSAPPALAARSAGRAGGFHAANSAFMRAKRSGGIAGGLSRTYGNSGRSMGMGASPWMRAPPLVGGGIVMAPSPFVVSAGPAVVGAASTAMDVTMVLLFMTMAASAVMSARQGGYLDGALSGSDAGELHLIKVQVGLVALARQLKVRLDSIAERADTASAAGLQQLLQETVLALLRNPEFAVMASLKQRTVDSTEELERRFNAASLNERAHYKEETLVNVGGKRSRRAAAPPAAAPGGVDELVVVTLLVASQHGDLDLPDRIDSLQDLQATLRVLGGLTRDQVLGVEVMWTPQADTDYYGRDEVAADFPDLVPL